MPLRIARTARRRSTPPQSPDPAPPGALAARVRDCAVTAERLAGAAGAQRAALRESATALLAAYAAALTESGRAHTLLTDDGSWAADHPELFEALLRTGRAAAATEAPEMLRLALRVADTLLAARPSSRAGWRLRARTLEALGDDAEAAAALERCATLGRAEGLGFPARATGLRESREHLVACVSLLRRDCPQAAAHAGADETELWATGDALRTQGAPGDAEPYLVAALAAMLESGRGLDELSAALTEVIDLRMERQDGRPDAALREVLTAFSAHRLLLGRDPAPDPGEVTVIGLSALRGLLAGRSVCLVADVPHGSAGQLGAEIDSYDVVARCGAFRIEPATTGRRTDLHATLHRHSGGWDVPVHTRLVFGATQRDWEQSVRRRLVPGAQTHLGDHTLRWPLADIGRLPAASRPATPTAAFTLAWLLDFLDVTPRLDLLGFDIAAATDDAAHPDRRWEAAWLTARACRRDARWVSLR